MFVVNDLVSIQKVSGEIRLERILWIDAGKVICYTIAIDNPKTYPVKRLISDLIKLNEEGLLKLEDNDPFSFIFQKEETLSDKSKKIRYDRLSCIKDIIVMEPEIYESEARGSIISEHEKQTGTHRRLLYKFLLQYWKRGQIPNALLPDYRNSGGKGKTKRLNKKNGPKRKFEKQRGEGIVITETIKQYFEISIKRYYHTFKKFPLATTFKMMLKDFFKDSVRYDNGVEKPILVSPDKRPTYKQFSYWYEQTYKTEVKLRKRKGDRKYNLEDRASLGISVDDLDGPGSKFQIDATIADVYLVSSTNRNWIIGRPVIYVVIDVFSRNVVGLYVGLEGPSWFGAMMAVANTASDKVNYCKQYGIDISIDEWICHYLPESLVADRGEFEGYNPERLISAFNTDIINTPPYRGDWKGIVERHFRIIHDRVKPLLPGSIDKNALTRGDRDYRLDGTLTIYEFTQIIIKCVLYHNNQHWLKHYEPDEQIVKEEVPLIPKELWNWGINNRSGKLRSYPENIIKLNLMPTGKALVNFQGINFKGMRYSSEHALREGWFGGGRSERWYIPICYDPRDMGQIYLPSEDGMSYEVATLLEHQKKYDGKTIEEVVYEQNIDLLNTQVHKESLEVQAEVDLNSDIDFIVNKAKKESKQEKIEMSNNQRTKGIRDNRASEKEERRKEEAFVLVENEKTPMQRYNLEGQQKEESENNISRIEALRRSQREKMKRARGS